MPCSLRRLRPAARRDDLLRPVFRRLDAALAEHVMRGLRLAHQDKQIYTRDLSSDPAFGRGTWQRTYPHPHLTG